VSTNSNASLRRSLAIVLFFGVGTLPSISHAQAVLGDWDLTSAISLRGGFENASGTTSHFLVAAPEFSLQRQGDDFTASLSGNMVLDQMGAEHFTPRSLGLQSNFGQQLNQHSQLGFGLSYNLSQPQSSDPDLPTGVKIGGHDQQLGLNGSYSHQFSKTGVQLRGSVGRSQTAASQLNDGALQSNAENNAWTYGVGGRISRELTPKIGIFVDTQLNRSRYDAGSAALAASRNNWSYEAQVGASLNFDERLRGDISLGQLRQTFDDASLDAVQTFTYNAALQWQATDTSQFSLDANTSVSPSTVAGEPMRIVDTGRLTFNHQMNSRTQISMFGEVERQHYQSSVDQILTSRAGLGVQYQANKQLSAFANYSFAFREEPAAVLRTHKLEAGLRFSRQ
jgi:hypothetical protein